MTTTCRLALAILADLDYSSVRRITIWEGVPTLMATGMILPLSSASRRSTSREPRRGTILIALGIALLFVFVTRWPVVRTQPFDSDEYGFLAQMASHWFPMHHTLFMTSGRVLGLVCGDPYQGFMILDMLTSAGAS